MKAVNAETEKRGARANLLRKCNLMSGSGAHINDAQCSICFSMTLPRYPLKIPQTSPKRTQKEIPKQKLLVIQVLTNIAMEHGPFEDVFSFEPGDIPLLC